MTADEVIARLGLVPLPGEGGFFRETYRSATKTAIYYLLTPTRHSRLHRLPGDEIYHFYLGDPVELLLLRPVGSGEVVVLGADLTMQVVVPGGVWQGSRLVPGGRWALLGTTMSPGFEFAHFTPGDAEVLTGEYPAFAAMIRALGGPEPAAQARVP